MKTVLDHTQDLSGSEMHRLTQLYPTPDFVKEASHDKLCGDPEAMRPHMYADVNHRLFPCHTKAATWMSSLFFGANHRHIAPSQAEPIRERIIKQASYFGIVPEVEALWAKMADDAAKGYQELPDEQFALVWTADGSKHRNYPLTNAVQIKQASDWFGKYHGEFSWADKHQIASKIVARSEEESVPISNSELLLKCAGFGYCAAIDAAAAWEKRASLVQTSAPAYAAEARKMAEVIRGATFEARDQGKRIKMAALMDQFDRDCRLNTLYDEGGLERSEHALFSITEKVASEFLNTHTQTTTGAIYEKTALEKLSLDDITRWMGDEFAQEVATGGVFVDMDKLAELLPTMPRDDAEMFERMTAEAGINPMAYEKAAEAAGMSDEDRQALAAQYVPATSSVIEL